MPDDDDFELIHRAWAAFSRTDDEALLRELHPEVEAVPIGAPMESRLYRGVDEVMGWLGESQASWEVFEVVPEEFRRAGGKILVTGRWHVRGKESGVELDIAAAWIVEVRDGKIAYWRAYTDHSQALLDIGLEG